MRGADILRFALAAALGNRGRAGLMLLAVAIGVSSVVLLISLGESARAYVSGQFMAMGSNLVIVLPGRSETVGGPPPLLGLTPRDLTLDDAASLKHLASVRRLSPIIVGAAPVSHGQKERETTILGAERSLFAIRRLEIAQGGILPESGGRAQPLCVIGAKTRTELFGQDTPLGQTIRVGDYRFRVVGVLRHKGTSLGDELSDVVIIPVLSAQALFNTSTLFRIVVEATAEEAIPKAKEGIISTIRARHDGEDDVTVITQDAILSTFEKIFRAMTLTVSGIALISLMVAGIIIMNVMLVAVSSRRAEIGLLKALGTPAATILTLFLTEAGFISLAGAGCGLAFGLLGLRTLAWFLPQFPILLAPWSLPLAAGVALATGLACGILPARRAARLTAVSALSGR